MTKTIPLKDVKSALICAVVRQKTRRPDGTRHGRCAAITMDPVWEPTCRDQQRARRLGSPAWRPPLHTTFSPMFRGDMDRLLERTRLQHGLQEVRRTWGAGMRALAAEFSQGAMR